MAQNDDYLNTARRLLEKTAEQKVAWKETFEQTTFASVLNGKYAFEISKTRNGYRLVMKDEAETDMFTLYARYPTEDTSAENDEAHSVLEPLYELARRKALNIDQKLSDV